MIILAQALNGFLLPLVGVFLLVVVNDRQLMKGRENGRWANVAMALVVGICAALGARGVLGAGAKIFDQPTWTELPSVGAVSLVVLVVLGLWTRHQLAKPNRRRAS